MAYTMVMSSMSCAPTLTYPATDVTYRSHKISFRIATLPATQSNMQLETSLESNPKILFIYSRQNIYCYLLSEIPLFIFTTN